MSYWRKSPLYLTKLREPKTACMLAWDIRTTRHIISSVSPSARRRHNNIVTVMASTNNNFIVFIISSCTLHSTHSFHYTISTKSTSSSHMCIMTHNWSATKQRLHLQSVVEINHHSVLSEDRTRQCGTSGSRHKDTKSTNTTCTLIHQLYLSNYFNIKCMLYISFTTHYMLPVVQ